MTEIDSVVFEFLHGLIGKSFLIDGVFVFFSQYLIYILTFVFGIYLVRVKNWKERVNIFALGALGVIISRGIFTPLVRFFLDRPRPFVAFGIDPLSAHEATGSFPSGHIAFIAPLMIALWYADKRGGTWGLIGVFLIGIARIGSAVHWPSDILGGFLVGIVGYAIAWLLLKNKLSKETGDVPTGILE